MKVTKLTPKPKPIPTMNDIYRKGLISNAIIGNPERWEVRSPNLEYKWELKVTKNYAVMQVTAPNWFHRKMQKLILGFEWRRI